MFLIWEYYYYLIISFLSNAYTVYNIERYADSAADGAKDYVPVIWGR